MLPRRAIQTDRLVLEPSSPVWGPEVFAAVDASAAELGRWLAWVPGRSLESTLQHLAAQEAAWRAGTGFAFVVVDEGRAVGNVDLRVTHNHRGEGSIGYWVSTAEAGRGYISEATAALVEFGFHSAGLDRIEIRADVRNRPSWRVAERVGMRREGLLRGGASSGDAYVYGMLAADPRRDARSGDDARPAGVSALTEPDFSRGLVTAVVQDELDGAVLMVAHMNEDAYARTRKTGRAWFWSRSRERLWEKGESSGNHLEVRAMTLDCDGDAVLLRVAPAGPACHTGARTCFHNPV
jgi:phosphoribosyl-AMP cyclohydrolase